MEQVHLLADAAVIAALGFGEAVEIGVELLLVAPGGAVDAAEHRVAMIAAPVGAGDLHQLERLADVAGAAHVGAAAQIDPVALRIEGDSFVFRQVLDQLGLVFLAALLEEFYPLVAVDHRADEGRVAGDDFPHPRLDRREVFRGERFVAREIIVKAVLDRRADGDLGAGIEVLHGLGQHMGGVVADHAQSGFVAAGDELHLCVLLDRGGQIDQPAVEVHRQRGARETRPDRLGDRGAGHRTIEMADRTIGQGYRGHSGELRQRNSSGLWRHAAVAATPCDCGAGSMTAS